MYGWRGRIAVVLPLDNTVLEPEFHKLMPEGTSFHVLRLDTGVRDEMLPQAARLAKTVEAFGADVILYACAETSFFKGEAATFALETRLTEEAGRPVVSATGAMLEALRALGSERPVVVTPYRPERGRQLSALLKGLGFHVAAESHRPFDDLVGDHREWWGVNVQPPTAAYELAREAVEDALAANRKPDAIVISATNFRTVEIIEPLERDTGLPVVGTNQAMLWAGVKRLGLREMLPLGALGGC